MYQKVKFSKDIFYASFMQNKRNEVFLENNVKANQNFHYISISKMSNYMIQNNLGLNVEGSILSKLIIILR